MKHTFLALFALFWGLIAPTAQAERALTVFAAASMGGVLEDIVQGYPGEVMLAYAGSGTMARQVAAGAPADVVILAHQDWMDWLVTQGVPGASDAKVIASNTLVVIAPLGRGASVLNAADLAGALAEGRLAMGQRDGVPAGIYARQWLTKQGVWPDLSTRLAETGNVRAALALVARGEAPLGVVYATDALADPKVTVVYKVPSGMHDPILYTAAALTPEGQSFVSYLGSADSHALFEAHGFGRARNAR